MIQRNGLQIEHGDIDRYGKRVITIRRDGLAITDKIDPQSMFERRNLIATIGSEWQLSTEEQHRIEIEIQEAGSNRKLPPIMRASQFIAEYPRKREVVIDGLLRRGETMNMIAATKIGKSWLATALALAGASGGEWLGRPVSRGDVLLLDNELHPETLSDRLDTVIRAMGLSESDYDGLMPYPLRGELLDILELGDVFEQFKPGQLSMIVVDALYRAMPAGAKENDNDSFRNVYNLVDRYAAKLDCAFVLIHHSTKGNQADKGVTDVGAGGGAMSRAADTHLVLRQHEEDGAAVVDAACRSFPPVNPFCMRWDFPLWHLDEELDPAAMKKARPTRDKQREHEQLVETYEENIIKALVGMPANQGSETAIKKHSGNGGRAFSEALAHLLRIGRVEMFETKHPGNGRPMNAYRLAENMV